MNKFLLTPSVSYKYAWEQRVHFWSLSAALKDSCQSDGLNSFGGGSASASKHSYPKRPAESSTLSVGLGKLKVEH